MNDIEKYDRENVIHDCYFDVMGRAPTNIKIKEVHDKLPISIKNLASEWGWSDTEVREGVYVWIKENKSNL